MPQLPPGGRDVEKVAGSSISHSIRKIIWFDTSAQQWRPVRWPALLHFEIFSFHSFWISLSTFMLWYDTSTIFVGVGVDWSVAISMGAYRFYYFRINIDSTLIEYNEALHIFISSLFYYLFYYQLSHFSWSIPYANLLIFICLSLTIRFKICVTDEALPYTL